MSSSHSLDIRLFILIKRIRIILDVVELKQKQYNNKMTDFVVNIMNLLETIQIYVCREELCDEMLDYGYKGIMYTEKIMNLLDSIYSDKHYKDIIQLLQQCRLKYM